MHHGGMRRRTENKKPPEFQRGEEVHGYDKTFGQNHGGQGALPSPILPEQKEPIFFSWEVMREEEWSLGSERKRVWFLGSVFGEDARGDACLMSVQHKDP